MLILTWPPLFPPVSVLGGGGWKGMLAGGGGGRRARVRAVSSRGAHGSASVAGIDADDIREARQLVHQGRNKRQRPAWRGVLLAGEHGLGATPWSLAVDHHARHGALAAELVDVERGDGPRRRVARPRPHDQAGEPLARVQQQGHVAEALPVREREHDDSRHAILHHFGRHVGELLAIPRACLPKPVHAETLLVAGGVIDDRSSNRCDL
mmetsp:Transcript_14267/g.33801  ORF Transcript_14267/g.33801 Transcript_14267/m.33801 type:complete len:209 (+) Transcript_14267:83-709(+)